MEKGEGKFDFEALKKLDARDDAEINEFACPAVALMKKIKRLGYAEALKHEYDYPSSADPDWLELVRELCEQEGLSVDDIPF